MTVLLFAGQKKVSVKKALATYESAQGQQINREKTTIFFSKSTSQAMQNTIKAALGVPVVQQYEKCLGLPSFIGRKKKESFDNIKQRVWKKLQGWEGKFISSRKGDFNQGSGPSIAHIRNVVLQIAKWIVP